MQKKVFLLLCGLNTLAACYLLYFKAIEESKKQKKVLSKN